MRAFRREAGAYVAAVDPAERAVLLDVVDEVIALVGAQDDPPADVLDVVIETEPVPPPVDPALRRLLPDASREDPEVAAEYRRLTEADLRSTKSENLRRLRAAVSDAEPDLVVVPSEAPAVAAALTDVRLVVSERLGIRTEEDADALEVLLAAPDPGPADGGPADVPDDDGTEVGGGPARATVDPVTEVRRFLATVYVVLGILQESLVTLMLDELGGDTAPTGRRRPHG